jgi:hypothetical protein
MKTIGFVAIALVAAVALAGCTTPSNEKGQGTASAVRITGSPATANPNSNVIVCWHVDGSGNIPHVALHWDTVSHAGASATFQDYKNTAYPDNRTQAATDGYDLPGGFCTAIPMGSDDLYYRAHALDKAGGNGKLSDEEETEPSTAMQGTVLAVTFKGDVPAQANGGSKVPICWSVTGSGHVPHTALHTDTVSHKTSTSFSDYRDAWYPNNATRDNATGYTLPGDFCTAVTMPANGTLYVRAHAMVTPPGVVSADEKAIAVNGSQPSTGVVATVDWASGTPVLTAAPGASVTVCWVVTGAPGTIPHTAVHTDTTSHAQAGATFTSYAGPAYYPNNTTAQPSYNLSGPQTTFCTNVAAAAQSGQTVYLRAHAFDSTTGTPGRLSPSEGTLTAQ